MLGFKRFDHAAITISGIELAEKIKKRHGQARDSDIDSVGTVERGACSLTFADTHCSNAQSTFAPDSSLHQNRIVNPSALLASS